MKIVWLGRTPYDDTLALQRCLHALRKDGACEDHLLLTEHEPVLTCGRRADARNLRVPLGSLESRGLRLVHVERGGEITYHGPGQLVAYPILDLRSYGQDIRRYVTMLEESAIQLLDGHGVKSGRVAGRPGVWVQDRKIASVGVFISRWVTMHGIAINIDPDLAAFDLIHPCGLVGVRMTSLAELSGRAPSLFEAAHEYGAVFSALFAAPSVTLR